MESLKIQWVDRFEDFSSMGKKSLDLKGDLDHTLTQRRAKGPCGPFRAPPNPTKQMRKLNMKHKFTGLALLAALVAIGASPAWGAEVVSSNIVGYHKMELSSGLSILGTQFVEVGGDAISIQSMITDGAAMGDEILFFDGTSYETFPFDDVTFNENWEEAGPGWVDNETGTQAVRAVAPGEGFWYRNGSEKDITVAGEVPAATSVEVTCGGKLQLVSIPLPISVNLQNIKFEGIAATDEVMFFNGTTYDTFPYDEVTFDENWEEAGPGWVDNETGTQAKKVVDLHEGFWLRAAASKVTVSVE